MHDSSTDNQAAAYERSSSAVQARACESQIVVRYRFRCGAPRPCALVRISSPLSLSALTTPPRQEVQDDFPQRKPRVADGRGHSCGHARLATYFPPPPTSPGSLALWLVSRRFQLHSGERSKFHGDSRRQRGQCQGDLKCGRLHLATPFTSHASMLL